MADALEESARRLRRRVRWSARAGRGAVLVYHRVATTPCDPWGLAIAPDRFGDQLLTLARIGDVRPLRQVLRDLGTAARGRPLFAVTFDDAYADNLHEALPRLEAADCPMTLFVAPSLVGRPWYWWDLLAHWAEGAGLGVEALVDGAQEAGILSPDGADALRGATPADVHVAVYQILACLPLETTEARVLALSEGAGLTPDGHQGRPMTVDELDVMAAHPLVELGIHTMTHPRLSRLATSAARSEIDDARSWLAARYGERHRVLAYPYGDTSPAVAATAGSCGIEHAVTTAGRWLGPHDGALDRPRLQPADVDAATFEAWLRATA